MAFVNYDKHNFCSICVEKYPKDIDRCTTCYQKLRTVKHSRK